MSFIDGPQTWQHGVSTAYFSSCHSRITSKGVFHNLPHFSQDMNSRLQDNFLCNSHFHPPCLPPLSAFGPSRPSFSCSLRNVAGRSVTQTHRNSVGVRHKGADRAARLEALWVIKDSMQQHKTGDKRCLEKVWFTTTTATQCIVQYVATKRETQQRSTDITHRHKHAYTHAHTHAHANTWLADWLLSRPGESCNQT